MSSDKWARLIWAALGYKPNVAQAEILREWLAGLRFMLICGGERAGKSFTSVAAALVRMGPSDDGEERMFWIVGPDYGQARAEFTYIFNALNKAGLVASASMPEAKTVPWVMSTTYGVRIETKTSSDISKLASFSIHGALMVEAAQQDFETWLKLRGRVSETRGWVILSGTLENGLPWYGSMLRKWKGDNAEGGRSFSLPTWSNTAIYPGGINDPEIVALRATMPEEWFMKRFAAEAQRAHGLVIPEFEIAVHVRPLELARDSTGTPLPVNLAVDPATHTYAALFVQKVGAYTHVLDAVYKKNAVAQDVIPEVMGSRFWKYVRRQDGNVIDIAGTQRHANKSQVEIWQDLAKVSFAYKWIPLEDTINTVRFRLSKSSTLGEPLLYFNSSLPNPEPLPDGSAAHVLSEFDLWRWPDRKPGQSEAVKPIDKANDAIKALGYWLVHTFGPVETRKKKRMVRPMPGWGN
jgi:hypothetical protein